MFRSNSQKGGENIMEEIWISTNELHRNIGEKVWVIFDCRYELMDKEAGMNEYLKVHIPTSYYASLHNDLSGVKKEHGGRHPLPEKEKFVSFLQRHGVTNDTTVVLYDDGSYVYASRFWFLLKWIGHSKIKIVVGGFSKWKSESLPTEKNEQALPESSNYLANFNDQLFCSMEYVKDFIKNNHDVSLIDSRDSARYRGEVEPIDRVAGRIPTAVNFNYSENIIMGELKSKEELTERFQTIPKDREVVVYCGSGVTGCVNVLALQSAGYCNVKLYSGSYSDWSSYIDNEIEKG